MSIFVSDSHPISAVFWPQSLQVGDLGCSQSSFLSLSVASHACLWKIGCFILLEVKQLPPGTTTSAWRWYGPRQRLWFLLWAVLLRGSHPLLYWAPFLVCFYAAGLPGFELSQGLWHSVQRGLGMLRVRDCCFQAHISNISVILQAWNAAKMNN